MVAAVEEGVMEVVEAVVEDAEEEGSRAPMLHLLEVVAGKPQNHRR